MERLSIATTFQKAIDSLKTTECSQKEKLALFAQISDCIQSPSLRSNAHYLNYLSNAITILLMFCEELDSVTRMSAEENLNKIIRFSTPGNIVRVQYDLFHEIIKNGNDRSLRISLNLFAYYCPIIKQRKARPYALNLITCIQSISKRSETLLIETLSEFMKSFCKYLQSSLHEHEILTLLENFVDDSLSECAVKRRCVAQNVIYIIEHAKNSNIMAKIALNRSLKLFIKSYSPQAAIGTLGFLRVLLPKLLSTPTLDSGTLNSVVEILEVCLHLLNDPSHTIINASLECICVIVNQPNVNLKDLLNSKSLKHTDILRNGKSLKNKIFNRKLSASSIEMSRTDTTLPVKDATKSSTITGSASIDSKNVQSLPESVIDDVKKEKYRRGELNQNRAQIESDGTVGGVSDDDGIRDGKNMIAPDGNDDKCLLSCSDNEFEPFKNMGFETTNFDSVGVSSPVGGVRKKLDSMSIKSQKSTESIGSFFNSILSHSNADTVSAFFRGGSAQSKAESTPATPKTTRSEDKYFVRNIDGDDNISLVSLGSQVSLNSHVSSSLGTFDVINKTEDPLPEIKILTYPDVAEIKINSGNLHESVARCYSPLPATPSPQHKVDLKPFNDIWIGHISEQPLVHYAIRLIASKFLLAGAPNELISDRAVRVSIKSLSLVVLGNCVDFCPQALLLGLQVDKNISGLDDYFDSVASDDTSSIDVDTIEDQTNAACTEHDKDSVPQEPSDELVIKDDHFGESSFASKTYFDFMSPLTKSADHVLLSQLRPSDTEKQRSKLNSDLTDLLSKSDIVESKSKIGNLLADQVPIVKDLRLISTPKKLPTSIVPTTNDECQFIEDVLEYSNHSDPILRANTQIIVGNFIGTVMLQHKCLTNFFETAGESQEQYKYLNLSILLWILLKGLADDAHVVVKQSLVAIDNILPHLLKHQHMDVHHSSNSSVAGTDTTDIKTDAAPVPTTADDVNTVAENLNKISSDLTASQPNDTKYESNALPSPMPPPTIICDGCYGNDKNNAVTIESMIHELQLVFENKYWVVQCKYCDLISKLDFQIVNAIYGSDQGRLFEKIFLQHLYEMLRDNDHRIRNNAASTLCEYVKRKSVNNNRNGKPKCGAKEQLLIQYVSDHVFKSLPNPLSQVKILPEIELNESALGNVLYTLTNKLLELNNKNQQFGIVKAILHLIKCFSPIHFMSVWEEFNLLEICVTFINQNYVTGTDLTCHRELIDICTNLLAGKAVAELKSNKYIKMLLCHIVKMLNVYHHVFTNQRPLFIPKGQKSDLFIGSKELHLLNSFGYFGNDYFYLKLHNLLKISFDAYEITITKDAGAKMLELLQSCLDSLAILLEIQLPSEISDSIKLIEELLMYLTTLINFMPERSINCLRPLLKFMFEMNFMSRTGQYEQLIKNQFLKYDNAEGENDIFGCVREFNRSNVRLPVATATATKTTKTTDAPASPSFKLIGIGGMASPSSDTKRMESGSNIKLFESIVIQCLKLFTKSNSKVQSAILDMLCQVLEYRVNYCLLDSNNVFIDFVLRLLELIETGTVRNSHIIIPSIIKFLFYLSKQKDKKLITIPKIINVTDTLLANGGNVQGSTEALLELAHELFFQENIAANVGNDNDVATNPGDTETKINRRDANTQKEVAFSMLLKFLNEPKVQEMVCLILLKNRCDNGEIESELFTTIIQLIHEQRFIIKNLNHYCALDLLFKTIDSKIYLHNNNLEKIINHLCVNLKSEQTYTTTNQLAVTAVLLENIIFHVGEDYLLNHIELCMVNSVDNLKNGPPAIASLQASSYFASIIDNVLHTSLDQINNISYDWMFVDFDGDLLLFINVLKIFFTSLLQFYKFPIMVECFKRHHLNGHLIDKAMMLPKQITSMATASVVLDAAVTESRDVVRIFAKFLLSIDCSNELWLHAMQRLAEGFEANMLVELLDDICKKYPELQNWHVNEVNAIIDNYLKEMLSIDAGGHLAIRAAASDVYSIKLLNQVKLLLMENNHSQKTLKTVLDILDNCNKAAISMAVQIILEKFLFYSRDNNNNINGVNAESLQRRSSIILLKKLNEVLQTGRESMASTEVHCLLPVPMFDRIVEIFNDQQENKTFSELIETICGLSSFYANRITPIDPAVHLDVKHARNVVVDDDWFMQQAEHNAFHCTIDKHKIIDMLSEIKSETKLNKIFQSNRFDRSLLKVIIKHSFDQIELKFKQDCLRHNPHMNYLKIPVILKQAIMTLIGDVEWLCATAFSLVSQPGQTSSASDSLHINSSNATSSADESTNDGTDKDSIEIKRCVQLTQLFGDINFYGCLINTMLAIIELMHCVDALENVCLVHIEAQFIEKFIKENVLKSTHNELFISFSYLCTLFVQHRMLRSCGFTSENMNKAKQENSLDNKGIMVGHVIDGVPAASNSIIQKNNVKLDEILAGLECADVLLAQKYFDTKLTASERLIGLMEFVLDVVHEVAMTFLANSNFHRKYSGIKESNVPCYCPTTGKECVADKCSGSCRRAIVISKLVELTSRNSNSFVHDNDCYTVTSDESRRYTTHDTQYTVYLQKTILSLAVTILRCDSFYFLAITPYEILANNGMDSNELSIINSRLNRLPSVPVEYLNDVEIVEKFVKRINIFGFPTRQHFEEFFMSLLLLVNKENDVNMMDIQEQYQIKNICLWAIVELLLSCKMYGQVGRRNVGKFHHIPRTNRIRADSISLRKLHKIQSSFLPEPTVFYQCNLEYCLSGDPLHHDNLIGTHKFKTNQFELNSIWQIVEEQNLANSKYVPLKNINYFIEKANIDLKSSIQLIFDVYSQLIEENYVLVLPHIVKLCELCENREQFRWIKDTMLKLQEVIHMENAVCHQYIIYCLCKSYAVLVPSASELNHLCTIIHTYLKSTHLFVRTATLRGLLSLVECCVKTNTTIGGLSEELLSIRTLVVNYITKYGIIEESPVVFSNEHTKLVWTLNFYLIETTSKFVVDCNLLSNTIISANNILKRTINLEQYLCILHGLERLVVMNCASKIFREKIEKIALDLVKLENEKFSIPALKLLVSCMYIGSAEQLENTELSNGIVQDDPEIIVQSTEKIDVLFNRIKIATVDAANIYGDVLCQLTTDLVPPKEILTKVIKELLTLSQPHCEVIAKILFQVFRSAIDSSYLPLLQDWLICSLPNFLSFPVNKAVWCLTIIFVSASINLHLIKIFPEVLAKQSGYSCSNEIDSDDILVGHQSRNLIQASSFNRDLLLFSLSAKDFYNRLNNEQKNRFRAVFAHCDVAQFQFMLNVI